MTFEDKYENVMQQIDLIIKSDVDVKGFKKYIDAYKLEKMVNDRNEKKMEDSVNNTISIEKHSFWKKKQIVGLSEIKEHEKMYDKFKYEKMAQRELNRLNQKEKNNEFNQKMENEMITNKKRVGSYDNMAKINDVKPMVSLNKKNKQKEYCEIYNKINQNKIAYLKVQSKENHKSQMIPLPNEISKSKISISQHNKKRLHYKIKKRNNNELPIESKTITTNKDLIIRKDTSMKKDYLKEGLKYAKLKKNDYDNLQYYDNKDFMNNIDNLKYKAQKYEDLAKKQEQLIKVTGGAKNNMVACEKISNYLVDSITAKISLIKQISS